MARTWVVLAHLVVFLVLVSESSAPTDHLSKSKDGKFDNENPSSTEGIRSLHSNNSTLDGFTSEEKTVDFDLEGLGKSNITGITSTTNASSSFIDSVSLNASPQSWLDDPSTWTITSFLALWGLLSIVIGVIAICYYLGFLRNRRKSSKRPKICQEGLTHDIPFSHIQAATNRFHRSKVISRPNPGFMLYEGHLPYHGRVTIKRLTQDKICPREYQLWRRGITHTNIVAIRGWAQAKDEFVLVYDYLPHSLMELLGANNGHNIKKFHTWESRFAVIHLVATALMYLHNIPMAHNNICSCRIFLDSDLNVKLGDLYHSVPPTKGISCDSTTSSPPPTLENDVYKFGIVMIEILSGKGHYHNDESLIVTWISNLWRIGRLLEASDPRLGGDYPIARMETMLKVALWCVQPNPVERPTISAVIQMIWGNIPISDPPPPASLLDIHVEPELLGTKKIEPKEIEPKKIEPKKIEPKEIEPELLEPKEIEPEKIEAKKIEPELLEAKKIEPELLEPKKIEQELLEPKKI